MRKVQRIQSATAALLEFKRRADLTFEKLAELAGYSQASGVQRYLDMNNPRDVFDIRITKKFAEALAGRGDPPITRREVYEKLSGTLPSEEPAYAPEREPTILELSASKTKPLPDGSWGLALTCLPGRETFYLSLTLPVLRELQSDLSALGDLLSRT